MCFKDTHFWKITTFFASFFALLYSLPKLIKVDIPIGALHNQPLDVEIPEEETAKGGNDQRPGAIQNRPEALAGEQQCPAGGRHQQVGGQKGGRRAVLFAPGAHNAKDLDGGKDQVEYAKEGEQSPLVKR